MCRFQPEQHLLGACTLALPSPGQRAAAGSSRRASGLSGSSSLCSVAYRRFASVTPCSSPVIRASLRYTGTHACRTALEGASCIWTGASECGHAVTVSQPVFAPLTTVEASRLHMFFQLKTYLGECKPRLLHKTFQQLQAVTRGCWRLCLHVPRGSCAMCTQYGRPTQRCGRSRQNGGDSQAHVDISGQQ